MALLMFEGFEGMGTTEGQANKANITEQVRKKFSVYVGDNNDDARPYLRPGEDSVGKSLAFQNIATTAQTNISWALPSDYVSETLVVGFRIKTPDHITTGSLNLFSVYADNTGNSDRQLELYIDFSDSNKLKLRRQATFLAESSANAIVNDTWQYIEFKFNVDDTTGLYEVRIDDTSEMSASGTDTRALSGIRGVNVLRWWGMDGQNNDQQSDEMLIDDIYVLDTTGTVNTSFLGSSTGVKALYPDAEGTTIDFTPSTGTDNSANVDDNPPGDTDYNDGGTNGDIDEYSVDSLTETVVYGVSVQTHVKPDVLGRQRTFRHRVRSGVTVGNGSDIPITDDSVRETIFETDPNTSAQWTNTNLNNAEFGVEVRD